MALTALSSCSSTSYNPDKCEDLKESIEETNGNLKDLSNEEVSQIIDQYLAVNNEFFTYIEKGLKDVKDYEDIDEITSSDEFKEFMEYRNLFLRTLDNLKGSDEMDKENEKKWKKVKREGYERELAFQHQYSLKLYDLQEAKEWEE